MVLSCGVYASSRKAITVIDKGKGFVLSSFFVVDFYKMCPSVLLCFEKSFSGFVINILML